MRKSVRVFSVFGLAGALLFSLTVSGLYAYFEQTAKAIQIGPAEQITLNPGGGVATDGTDGIRFTMNALADTGNPNYQRVGGDAMVHRNTYQYCCGAGAPMLNIGGTLYGQAGPATSAQRWDSIEVLSTSGATSIGARTAAVGNSSATLRYTKDIGGLVYTMTRTVSYLYPNDFVNDSYSFVIPEGNTATVKFYLGGDTAPGSSDSGFGVMLTDPVRSVISLNTFSQILFGFREVSGSKPFDGATSQHYSVPYATVTSGGDIGYVVTSSNHDAGLMMQWNLGSTPGTQTASFQQFATRQGTNLNAVLSSTTADVDQSVNLTVSIANTVLSEVSGLGYTLTLPAGLVIGTGSVTNTCGGTASHIAGTALITLTGATVASGANCVITLPVSAAAAGTYAIVAGSFSGLEGSLVNNVGSISLSVVDPEVGDDVNGDGISDSEQPNIYSYTSGLTERTVALEAPDACTVNSAASINVADNPVQDEGYEYVNGLMDFSLSCGVPGYAATVTQYYYNVPMTEMTLRKFNPNTQTYFTIEDAVLTQETINSQTVTTVTYEVVDGGVLDMDGVEDGQITDPAGLATVPSQGSEETPGIPNEQPGVPNTGLPASGVLVVIGVGIVGLGLVSVGLALRRNMRG